MEQRVHKGKIEHKHNGYAYWHPKSRIHPDFNETMNADLKKCSENLIRKIDKILYNNGLSDMDKMELLTSTSDDIFDKVMEIACRNG